MAHDDDSSTGSPNFATVTDVVAGSDCALSRPTARRRMLDAGAFYVGRRLLVSIEDLEKEYGAPFAAAVTAAVRERCALVERTTDNENEDERNEDD